MQSSLINYIDKSIGSAGGGILLWSRGALQRSKGGSEGDAIERLVL